MRGCGAAAADGRAGRSPRAGRSTRPECDDDQKRPAKARRARRRRRDRQRQHRDRIDHPERDDRERDRLEPDADSAEPAQHSDLDDVVEAERQHGTARRRRADRGEAAGLVRLLLGREQPVPAACADDEAREVAARGHGDEERPARARAASSCASSAGRPATQAAIVTSVKRTTRRRAVGACGATVSSESREDFTPRQLAHQTRVPLAGWPGGFGYRASSTCSDSRTGSAACSYGESRTGSTS